VPAVTTRSDKLNLVLFTDWTEPYMTEPDKPSTGFTHQKAVAAGGRRE
jgi:hypothetical protein